MNYNIFIKSDEHARNINTPMMGRVNYTLVVVQGRDALVQKVQELRAAGEVINDIRTDLGTRIWL